MGDAPENVKARVEILGFVERKKVKSLLMNARYFLCHQDGKVSQLLQLKLSVQDARLQEHRWRVCISMQGFSGTTAPLFEEKAIFAALLQDSIKWDNGMYDRQKIAEFWRPILNRKSVAKDIENLAKAS